MISGCCCFTLPLMSVCLVWDHAPWRDGLIARNYKRIGHALRLKPFSIKYFLPVMLHNWRTPGAQLRWNSICFFQWWFLYLSRGIVLLNNFSVKYKALGARSSRKLYVYPCCRMGHWQATPSTLVSVNWQTKCVFAACTETYTRVRARGSWCWCSHGRHYWVLHHDDRYVLQPS